MTPTPTPTPQKSDTQFWGIEASESKNSLGGGLIGQNKDFTRAISCLGVCYTNDPQKGGYTTPAPALDLTTSLRGDKCFPSNDIFNAFYIPGFENAKTPCQMHVRNVMSNFKLCNPPELCNPKLMQPMRIGRDNKTMHTPEQKNFGQ